MISYGSLSMGLFAFLVVWIFHVESSLAFSLCSPQRPLPLAISRKSTGIYSSYGREYNDFGDFDDEDEDEDDDDEYTELDDAAVADFRSRMGSMFGDTISDTDDSEEEKFEMTSVDELIGYARSLDSSNKPDAQPKDWATSSSEIQPGVVLLANPAKFCTEFGNSPWATPSPQLLSKFGLTLPPPAELGPDRRADLLPVLIVVQEGNEVSAVLLNRRTGYLLGDLEQPTTGDNPTSSPPMLEKFCIQPLWFGGIDSVSSGIDMLHMCPTVEDATQLTDDGLFWGGDPAQAQDAMEDPSLERVLSGFDFKFFVQTTVWRKRDLEKQVQDGTWFLANVSKEVLFKSRDRMGTRRAKPLWTEIMELLGGEYQDVRDQLYDDS